MLNEFYIFDFFAVTSFAQVLLSEHPGLKEMSHYEVQQKHGPLDVEVPSIKILGPKVGAI